MAKVDFYILEQASGLKSLHYACQLIEKSHNDQKSIYIQTNSREEAERMDTLLWTYRDDSFLPHCIYNASDMTDDSSPPILIGYSATADCDGHPKNTDVTLFNLSSEIPRFYQQCSHIIEIVFSDPVVQQLARERFKQYRDQGCEINTYKIKASEL